VSDEPFVEPIQIFTGPASTPMIPNGIVDDLHQQCAGMNNFFETTKGFESVERDVLFEILVMDRGTRSLRSDVNESANLSRIKIHVTVFLSARLYLA
jgi:hypothetical protein